MKPFGIGIIGAGHIAGKMARTLRKVEGIRLVAIGSRSLEKAQAFAQENGVERAYGSYQEVFEDNEVELVYVATPNSHHYEQAKQALLSGKPVLMEKAFTMNGDEAEELIRLAQEKHLFLGEAILTRYLPLSHKIKELLQEGAIGQPMMINAALSYNVIHKERVLKPELGGGAMLDLGVYLLHFAQMCFGTEITNTQATVQWGASGVDLQESITLTYADGRMANLLCGVLCRMDRQAVIGGTEGHLRIDNVNNPTLIEVYRNFDLIATYHRPEDCVTGYEYEVIEAMRCIRSNQIESPLMPHSEILSIMRQADSILSAKT